MSDSEALKRAKAAYIKSRDNLIVRPSKEEGAAIRAAAAAAGKSVQAYILEILREHTGYTPAP